MPDLSQALCNAPTEIKRQVFDAFGLQIVYDKPNRRIEISATITETIAQALHNAEDLPQEAFVAHRDIAGARLVRRSDARILDRYRLLE